MRLPALATLLALLLAAALAACGGGGGGETGSADTGTTGETTATTTAEPPGTTPQNGSAFQIKVPKAGQPIGPQSPEEQVIEVQKALVLLRYKVGQPDGIYGNKTLNAVRSFQRKHKLAADGLVGANTARAINKELRKKGAQA